MKIGEFWKMFDEMAKEIHLITKIFEKIAKDVHHFTKLSKNHSVVYRDFSVEACLIVIGASLYLLLL